jgi:hypothetical protein
MALIDAHGAKFPFASQKQAIRYTPGEAKVAKTQRIELRMLEAKSRGIVRHHRDRLLTFFSLSKGVSSVTSSGCS